MQIGKLSENNNSWHKDAIIYEVHVKSFFDGNNDGIGDFIGLTAKLDYLEDLGIDTIWLLPFFVSPLKDDGYDVADYFNIHPNYGALEDFKIFIKECKKRKIRLIIELVVNHVSDQHYWFKNAIELGEKSRFWDYFIWSDTQDLFKETRIIFSDTEKSNWAWQPDVKKFYWHRFFTCQPDLNHNNPKVAHEMNKIIKFWGDMGVDGFRLDAIPYLCVKEGTNNENLPETHLVIKTWRKYLDNRYKNIKIFLAEANQHTHEVVKYFGNGDECNMAFNFPLMPKIFIALKKESGKPIVEIMENLPEIPENCQWGIFLRNHDELTLEKVSDEERDYMYNQYAKDPKMRLNLGIRRRLAPLVNNDKKILEILCSILFSFPGTPIIYYGDEIGMGDNYYLQDRNGLRTPMQWNSDKNAGFSKASADELYLPLIIDEEYGYQSVNVESQQRQPSSLLSFVKKMIRTRKKYKVFGRGKIEFLKSGNEKILVYSRTYKDQIVICLVNLAGSRESVELDLSEYYGNNLVEIFEQKVFARITGDASLFKMQPHSFFWFELQK